MKNKIRHIFKENWSYFKQNNTVSEHIDNEITKMINCSRNSCNSRICSSCGKRYTDNWSIQIEKSLLKVPHYHFVLTVPESVRYIFRNWNNLKRLMDCSNLFFKKAAKIDLV